MRLRVLTWNLFHGRSVPPVGHDLFDEFAAALQGWQWEVALLQEVPPWWAAPLSARIGCDYRMVLTSRNALLSLRRSVAIRWPDLIKSNGGGSNAILVRSGKVAEHRSFRLGWWPERRWLHAVRLDLEEDVWVGNLHTEARADQGRRAATTLRRWAGASPAVLGGDFNVHDLRLADFEHCGGHDADHLFTRGLVCAGDADVLDRGRLSDHAPVAVAVGD
jgi:endonuclease/exonuclease/phosphatase family metal-dependent hydrolase